MTNQIINVVILFPVVVVFLTCNIATNVAATSNPIESDSICDDENEIYLPYPSPGKCFEKARLFQECTRNEQCTTPDSYCGLHEDYDDYSVCVCKVGFIFPDRESCIPYHRCSIKHFNSDSHQADCPTAKHFCRHEICLCIANYAYNSTTKQCEWNVPDKPEPVESNAEEEKFQAQLTIKIAEKRQEKLQNAKSWFFLKVTFWSILVIVWLLAIMIFYRRILQFLTDCYQMYIVREAAARDADAQVQFIVNYQ